MDGSLNTDVSSKIGGTQAYIPEGLFEFGKELTAALDAAGDAEHKPIVRAALTKKLECCTMVGGVKPACCPERNYGREMVYLDPLKRFTLLVLRWKPGAATPIHGHNAWGVVGVSCGDLEIVCYDLDESDMSVAETQRVTGTAGDVACVNPAPEGIHTIGNCSDEEAYSIHIYGMDLSSEPEKINVYY